MSISELVATTWENREKKTADAVADNLPFLYMIREAGNKKTISGGREIYEDILSAQNGYVQSIDPSEEIAIGYNQVATAFSFSPKIVVVPVVINALERAQNAGDGRFRDLFKTRMKVAESSLKNKMEGMMQGDGTGTGGKDYAGIKAYISKTPAVGTIGGVSRVSVTSIRNTAVNAVSTWGTATSASNIESRLRDVKSYLIRDTDTPSLCLAGRTYYNAAGDALSAKQRYTKNEKLAQAGFENIVIEGMTMILSSGKQFSTTSRINADECYLLNPSTFALKNYQGYDMQPVGDRSAYNQLVDLALIVSIGNLTINNPGLNGVMFDS